MTDSALAGPALHPSQRLLPARKRFACMHAMCGVSALNLKSTKPLQPHLALCVLCWQLEAREREASTRSDDLRELTARCSSAEAERGRLTEVSTATHGTVCAQASTGDLAAARDHSHAPQHRNTTGGTWALCVEAS